MLTKSRSNVWNANNSWKTSMARPLRRRLGVSWEVKVWPELNSLRTFTNSFCCLPAISFIIITRIPLVCSILLIPSELKRFCYHTWTHIKTICSHCLRYRMLFSYNDNGGWCNGIMLVPGVFSVIFGQKRSENLNSTFPSCPAATIVTVTKHQGEKIYQIVFVKCSG